MQSASKMVVMLNKHKHFEEPVMEVMLDEFSKQDPISIKDIEMNPRQSNHFDQGGQRQDPTQYSVIHTFDRPSLTNENENDGRQ